MFSAKQRTLFFVDKCNYSLPLATRERPMTFNLTYIACACVCMVYAKARGAYLFHALWQVIVLAVIVVRLQHCNPGRVSMLPTCRAILLEQMMHCACASTWQFCARATACARARLPQCAPCTTRQVNAEGHECHWSWTMQQVLADQGSLARVDAGST